MDNNQLYGEQVKEILEGIVASKNSTLTSTLHSKLTQCGWADEVKLECTRFIKDRGIDNVSVEEVVEEVTPIARKKVPMEVKKDLVSLLKDALMQELEKSDMKP